MTEVTNQPEPARTWDDVMSDAIRALTEAARLRRPPLEAVTDGDGQATVTHAGAVDWAEFVTLAVAGAVANVGSVEKALQGRPGSWEADSVRTMLASTVGEDPAELLRHRTEPLRVVLDPAEMLLDLSYGPVYQESHRILAEQMKRHVWSYQLNEDRTWAALEHDAPPHDRAPYEEYPAGTILHVPRSDADEAEYDRLCDLEGRLVDLEYDEDPRAYGEALLASAAARAAELLPGLDVEFRVDLDVRTPQGLDEFYGPEDELLELVQESTPLPWSGLTPRDYPSDAAALVALERDAQRLPHQRLT